MHLKVSKAILTKASVVDPLRHAEPIVRIYLLSLQVLLLPWCNDECLMTLLTLLHLLLQLFPLIPFLFIFLFLLSLRLLTVFRRRLRLLTAFVEVLKSLRQEDIHLFIFTWIQVRVQEIVSSLISARPMTRHAIEGASDTFVKISPMLPLVQGVQLPLPHVPGVLVVPLLDVLGFPCMPAAAAHSATVTIF